MSWIHDISYNEVEKVGEFQMLRKLFVLFHEMKPILIRIANAQQFCGSSVAIRVSIKSKTSKRSEYLVRWM